MIDAVIPIVVRVAINALALLAATLVPGIELGSSSTGGKIGTLVAVAVIFGIVNAVLKPIIKVIGCGFYLLTLGLIAVVVNALLFLLVGWLAQQVGLAFSVDGFWAGFWGAIIVAVVSFFLSLVIPDKYDKR
ncbi:phage holin family protein [Actinopolymorpha pittospori]|uniref:Membrane protein n=1 Tax=Actinopolymorpha pittospori TaxID=648752 RepID=A0A927RN22_9ACTN|nr:phage holin family protein [Actinopolymorpha pittospori]MBE1610711.1 putative membrane protein [Actinopolymorpha pittospori]